ncbi:MAG: hypothetical protein N5P05_003076 [Chroococcopsis gigantea SAG 12.99]|jgi:hypothetical protein|nr:XisI protein [Chlorogloea purpurea SAG 13.99]MDV3001470.1 hypothetical protein [Chroococcopsis gigantea SAG 12.99]
MDRVNQYRHIVQDLLMNFCKKDHNAQLVFDKERDRYLVIHNEWRNDYRIYGCAMQLDIIEGKIWLQHNSTEIYVERELIDYGVSPEDIIFGFRSPTIREMLVISKN